MDLDVDIGIGSLIQPESGGQLLTLLENSECRMLDLYQSLAVKIGSQYKELRFLEQVIVKHE